MRWSALHHRRGAAAALNSKVTPACSHLLNRSLSLSARGNSFLRQLMRFPAAAASRLARIAPN